MKATGIVRRIDDLGRIVIPKEIRRTMRIREGDPMEIFTNREGEILLKKYSPVGELTEFAQTCADSMSSLLGELVFVSDRDYIIAAAGPGKKEYEGKSLTSQLQDMIEKRENVLIENGEGLVKITQEDDRAYQKEIISAIISNGDCVGAVIICAKKTEGHTDEVLKQVAKTMAIFLGKEMEQ